MRPTYRSLQGHNRPYITKNVPQLINCLMRLSIRTHHFLLPMTHEGAYSTVTDAASIVTFQIEDCGPEVVQAFCFHFW